MNRILIVEDEARIATFIEKGLRARGFTTNWVEDGTNAIAMAISTKFDLAILDLGLPGKDGLSVLEELRGQGLTIPVIILTARDDISDKVIGLRAGADDYITKPFSFEELLARIEVRLRTYNPTNVREEMILKVGNVSLDLRTRKMQINNCEIELSAREFTMAEVFFRHPGQVMSRQQLLDLVWGYDYDPGSNIVDVYVGYLRKKLGSQSIETVRGMGYRLKI
ncbi:two component transcriptional regulator, winged helix family [Stanieria cyanosphaera PCC 7437]|uniref:Two component transcriptional regulator, winged helix family n=1 Tax=Stanieria cyanosphaera (strain ATCC 29371 / PCC 7437) TaxID=111780 RepID=K9XSS7_STAC7|nr:response regulator transcription factor [Stanieria cyanosphaera]AFZ35126.1 two component transcriptional regulator, winged helix family [Stanieria cyanosphaera PCC 7437]